jgi:hypothetical protein
MPQKLHNLIIFGFTGLEHNDAKMRFKSAVKSAA